MSSTLSRPRSVSSPPAAVTLLTTAQLADLLHVSLRTLERGRQDGTGVPFIKLGRRVLYRRSDVEDVLEALSFTSTAEVRRAREGT
jgi:excisionase family DNA binding protein